MMYNNTMTMPKYKPSFSLSAEDLPAIKEWNVGKKYKVMLEVEMTSISSDNYDMMGGESKELSARFQVVSAKDMTQKPVGDMNKKEFGKLHVNALSANKYDD